MKAQSLVWAGETQGATRVDDWPNPARALKTIMIHTDDFVGSITFQASLHGAPGENDWFDFQVEEFEPTAPNEDKKRNRIINSRDRFIWMRVVVETIKGRVDRILVI